VERRRALLDKLKEPGYEEDQGFLDTYQHYQELAKEFFSVVHFLTNSARLMYPIQDLRGGSVGWPQDSDLSKEAVFRRFLSIGAYSTLDVSKRLSEDSGVSPASVTAVKRLFDPAVPVITSSFSAGEGERAYGEDPRVEQLENRLEEMTEKYFLSGVSRIWDFFESRLREMDHPDDSEGEEDAD
jgi:hypothetical protein